MVMQSQGGMELVAELPQSPKKHDYRGPSTIARPGQLLTRALMAPQVASRSPQDSSRWGLIENQGRGERDES